MNVDVVDSRTSLFTWMVSVRKERERRKGHLEGYLVLHVASCY